MAAEIWVAPNANEDGRYSLDGEKEIICLINGDAMTDEVV